MALHHKIRHHLHKFHRMRKKKEQNLPLWKEKWNSFNETKLGWLEKFVDKLIPWLVLALLAIILGEFSHQLNFANWQWMEKIATFFDNHTAEIKMIDQIVVGFFIVDLYFNFFKKATVLSFIKTSFLDILAVAPLGLIFRAELGEAQTILHITEKEASIAIKEGEEAAKILKLENISTKTPRMLRLYRITQFFGKKDKKETKK